MTGKKPEPKITITQENQHTTIKYMVELIKKGLAGGAVVATLGREKRSKDQNAKMWPMLRDIAKQVVWYGQKYTEKEWKDILTAGLTKQKMAPGIDGGVVMLGVSTSDKSKAWLSEMIELMHAFGSEKNVEWSEKALEAYAKYR